MACCTLSRAVVYHTLWQRLFAFMTLLCVICLLRRIVASAQTASWCVAAAVSVKLGLTLGLAAALRAM